MSRLVDRLLETTVAGDVPPVMAGVSPLIQARKKFRMRPRPKKKAVESIIGEASSTDDEDEESQKPLIPDDAEPVLSDDDKEQSELDGGSTPIDKPGHEALLNPSMAIVAPDLTPDADKELDPALVPSFDPAIAAVLGDPPLKKATITAPEVAKKPAADNSPANESVVGGLPSGEMPLPPGTFLRSVASYLGESEDSDKPKTELVNKTAAFSPSLGGGFGHQGEMPRPVAAKTEAMMRTFRRFHRIPGPVNL